MEISIWLAVVNLATAIAAAAYIRHLKRTRAALHDMSNLLLAMLHGYEADNQRLVTRLETYRDGYAERLGDAP